MSADTTTDEAMTVVTGLRPRRTSANIRTWIGFKEFMQLTEEAVLGWFRARGYGPQQLFHDCGVGLRVLDSSVLLPAVLEVDDEVRAEVTRSGPDRFVVWLSVDRGDDRVRVLRGRVSVALVAEAAADVAAPAPVPDELCAMVSTAPSTIAEPAREQPSSWEWWVRYPHCHYSDVVQHSTYVRVLEEAVDRYLAQCGLSVPALLADRGWIPVVSRARVTVHADARMDAAVRTSFAVSDIVGGRAFDGRLECHVVEGDRMRRVASGTILHGYAISRGPKAGQLAELDGGTAAALLGESLR
jgi:acyl-CoA thioesterase FadM